MKVVKEKADKSDVCDDSCSDDNLPPVLPKKSVKVRIYIINNLDYFLILIC